MGADASKLRRNYFKRKRNKRSRQYSSTSSSFSSYDDSCFNWSLVASVPLSQWKLFAAEQHGFDIFDNWYIHVLKVIKRPWSRFEVLGRMKKNRKEIKVCSFPCQVDETGREEKVSWWIRDMSVLAMNSQVMVVQIVVNKALKILVVNWHLDKLLGTYTFAYNEEPCLQECIISPDSSVLLLRQNFYLRRCLGHISSFDANIRVIRVNNGLCERLSIIEDMLAYGCFGSGISFDPRFNEGRVVIVSSAIQPIHDVECALQIYDIPSQMVVQTTEACTDKLIHHIKHSPDGNLLAVLCINMSVATFTDLYIDSVLIMDTDSLMVLNVIPFPTSGPVKLLHTMAFPVFSRNGHYLAQVHADSSYHVNLYQMPCTELSLQYFCRSVILHYTAQNQLHLLPLPRKLITYLQFR